MRSLVRNLGSASETIPILPPVFFQAQVRYPEPAVSQLYNQGTTQYTTKTMYTSCTSTSTSCSVNNSQCTSGIPITTITVSVSTIVYPVIETALTSTLYTTQFYTETSCPSERHRCIVRHVTTQCIPLARLASLSGLPRRPFPLTLIPLDITIRQLWLRLPRLPL